MDSSIPPPPPAAHPSPAPSSPATEQSTARRGAVAAQPGQLTLGWTTVFWIGWALVGASFGAVWYSSHLTGFATWWLGPKSEPRYFLTPLPFVAPLALSIMALRGARRLPWFGLGGSVVCAAIAAGDLGVRTGYALVEFAIAASALLISVASFAGILQPAESATAA